MYKPQFCILTGQSFRECLFRRYAYQRYNITLLMQLIIQRKYVCLIMLKKKKPITGTYRNSENIKCNNIKTGKLLDMLLNLAFGEQCMYSVLHIQFAAVCSFKLLESNAFKKSRIIKPKILHLKCDLYFSGHFLQSLVMHLTHVPLCPVNPQCYQLL